MRRKAPPPTSAIPPSILVVVATALPRRTFSNHNTPTTTPTTPISKHNLLSVAVVGSGPSGCYTAKYIKAAWEKNETNGQIDVLERLPTPYGLVRFGVAPDHPEVKNVQHDFDSLFSSTMNPQQQPEQQQQPPPPPDGADVKRTRNCDGAAPIVTVNYLGNVQVGKDVTLQELRERYHAVVLATGCESDKRLGLPNEDTLSGILSAREFVAWYNGHPDFLHIGPQVQAALQRGDADAAGTDDDDDEKKKTKTTEVSSLSSSSSLDQVRSDVSVVVVGHGNVALDCARVLAKGGKGLYDTDIAAHVLPVLGNGVARVTLVGRRGHIQGAFTIKEVRELVKLQEEGFDTDFIVRKDELDLGTTDASKVELQQGRPKQRIDKLLRQAEADSTQQQQQQRHERATSNKQVHLRFLLSPSSWEPDQQDPNKLGALICERTRLEGEPGKQNAVGTGEMERIPAQLALLSIGYKGIRLPGLTDEQFDPVTGTVRHTAGCIEKPNQAWGGLYASGWYKRGPSGIIGTNIPDARETVASILQDLENNSSSLMTTKREGNVQSLLKDRGIRFVDWDAYQKIVAKEASQKRSEAQPREKIANMSELLETALG